MPYTLRLEQLIKEIDDQNFVKPPAQTLKKLDNKDVVMGILSIRHQKMYRLLLEHEDVVEDLLDRLTDDIELYFDESSEEGHTPENFNKFNTLIRKKFEQEYFKITRYRWIKTNFDAEIEMLFGIHGEKFIGIREGTTVVRRDDNSRGDQSRAEEFCFRKNTIACILQKFNEVILQEIREMDESDEPSLSSDFPN